MKIYYSHSEIIVFFVFVLCGNEALGLNGSVVLREKRGLVFPSGGTFKLVIGLGTPIKLSKTRTITVGWNFQWQYPLPVNTTAIETYPPILSRKTRDDFDVRRKEIFEAVENFLSGHTLNLKDCLVRYVCEEAYSSFKHPSNGPYGYLLHIILSLHDEQDEEIHAIYRDASEAGKFGADCSDLYPNCEEDMLMNRLFSLDFT